MLPSAPLDGQPRCVALPAPLIPLHPPSAGDRAVLVEITAARYNRRTKTATYTVRPLDPSHPSGKSVRPEKEHLREWRACAHAGAGKQHGKQQPMRSLATASGL